MATITQQEVVDYIKGISALELRDLIATLERDLGVSAEQARGFLQPNLPAIQTVMAEEQTEFTVTMTSFGATKINVIKAIREITGLGLKEAKDFVEGAPVDVKVGIPKAEAEAVRLKLEAAGATAAIR